MAVLSNKPVHPSRAIVEALGMGDYFVRIYGGNSFPTKKPDPLGVRTLLEETGVAPEQALMIGDSSIDVLTHRRGAEFESRKLFLSASAVKFAQSPCLICEICLICGRTCQTVT